MHGYGYDLDPVHVVESVDGTTRAAVYQDTDWHDGPDGDGYGIVLRRTYGRDGYDAYAYDVVHADAVDGDARLGGRVAGELADRLTTAGRYADGDAADAVDVALSRAAVDWHEYRSHVDRSGDDYLTVVTADHVAAWGVDADRPNLARDASRDWQAWLDGEVYYVAIERRVSWSPDVDDLDDRESWESTDTVVGGFYGADYVESVAADMLAEHVDQDGTGHGVA